MLKIVTIFFTAGISETLELKIFRGNMQPKAWEMGACNACLVSSECLAPALFFRENQIK